MEARLWQHTALEEEILHAVTPVCRVQLGSVTLCSRRLQRLCDIETLVTDRAGILQHRTDHCAIAAKQIVSFSARPFQLHKEV